MSSACFRCPICGKNTTREAFHHCSERAIQKLEREYGRQEEQDESEEEPDFEERLKDGFLCGEVPK